MVTVSYTLSLVDNLTSNVRLIENVSNERFFVSEHDTIPAIDISVQKMNRGEHAVIDADIRLGYGDIGCEEKQIPPTTSLNPYRMKIDLELHDWKSALDVQTLSIEDRLHWGEKKRQMGNFYYRRQDYPISLQCYHGALRFLDTDNNPLLASCDENQRLILNDHYITVQNNVAQVNLHLDKYDACLHAVENVLKHDPKNVKALFRQGKALFKLGTYDKAIQPLKLLAQIQRGNSTPDLEKDKVNEMISVCENKLANYQKNEKEIYRRMFQPPPPTTTSTLNQQRQTKNKNQVRTYFIENQIILSAF
jgi:FK506-binding protein 8